MMPGLIMKLERMPMTANGKLDRIALRRIYETK
jgi:acyl-coenzyme A synthetase/AMP-(fatty) acid ligase